MNIQFLVGIASSNQSPSNSYPSTSPGGNKQRAAAAPTNDKREAEIKSLEREIFAKKSLLFLLKGIEGTLRYKTSNLK